MKLRCVRRILTAGLGFAAAVGVMTVTVRPAVASTPGMPGVPQAPTAVFTEGFENGQITSPILITGYTGAAPVSETYTADPAWLTDCNGLIVSRLDPPGTGCGGEAIAAALGQFAGQNPNTNHAVTAFTGALDPGADKVELETVHPIPVPANRFLTFSVDAAEVNCNVAHAQLKFFLLDGSTAIPTFTNPIDPCTGQQTVGGIPVGHYTSDHPVMFSGSSLGIRLLNG